MAIFLELVEFSVEGQRYALRLEKAERVFRAAEVSPLPKAPDVVLGIVNVQGRILPVFSVRKRFMLPAREIRVNDQFLIASTSGRTVVLWVDSVIGVLERPERDRITPETILPSLPHVEGVMKLEDGLILIHDIEKFLSIEESETLDKALKQRDRK